MGDLRDHIAPSIEDRAKVRRYVNDYAYYVIIAVVSLVGMFVPPLVFGSVAGDPAMNFPQTPQAWMVWGITTGSVAVANVSILVMFKMQAKKNVRNDPNYIEANRILNRLAGNRDAIVPRSPRAVSASDYIKKGITITAGTFASFMAIAPLIINFDVMTLLSTIISVMISLCASWSCMIRNEEYWTEEYLLYAKLVEAKLTKKKEAEQGREGRIDDRHQGKVVPEHPGAGLAEHPGDQAPHVGDQHQGEGDNPPRIA